MMSQDDIKSNGRRSIDARAALLDEALVWS